MTSDDQCANSFVELFNFVYSISCDLEMQAQISQEFEGSRQPELSVHLQDKLAKLTLADIGLTEKVLSSCFVQGYITDTTVYETESLSFHLFGLKTGDGFPLHNHPHMLGITVILTGRVTFRSLSITAVEGIGVFCKQAARGEIQAPGSLFLTARHGNIHEIYATEDALLLDIFVPYYNSQRDCTFFKQATQIGDVTVLTVVRPPSLRARSLAYRGPKLSV